MRLPRKSISFFCLTVFAPGLSRPCPGGIKSIAGFVSIFDQLIGRRLTSGGGIDRVFASYAMDANPGVGQNSKGSNCSPIGCSKGDQDSYIWSSPKGGGKIDLGKQIFCNRSLNMRSIGAVGFDMDYTLAQYKSETFESLAYEGTVRKLVYDLGYPPELLKWSFDWTYMVRGLVLDKKRGNILKMDRHKYVKVAYHGFKEMSKEDKILTYGNTLVRDSFDEPEYALIDTLFSLAEAYLFAQLVEFKDEYPAKIPKGVDYASMYKDVRSAVDLCHRDGTLKKMVAKDPKRYINEDSSIVPMLKMLRDSGRTTFLVTNSLWDYTNIVMKFLCEPHPQNSSSLDSFDWLRYFDVVITGSMKPSFFHDENRANLFIVQPESGMLINTDNGTPLATVGDIAPTLPLSRLENSRKVFQGGNVGHLHKLLSIESSSQHQREQIRLNHQQAQQECHQKFHKVWGQLMKAGYQNSRFAHQVERFACLYTSQVSNLGLYSPDKYYRPSEDFMPHEFDIFAL